ncbi:hypothetical protein BHE74_00033967 [Ensete ventricosum]|nr:hypothetical protein BHE74_00033967 [Ensete ventricosum]RZS10610.1 hypothetical protein BHM03_00041852 [Ensete ventricosum]
MNTASTGRYGPVLSLIGTQNARYQAKKREKKRENLESSAALLICCPRSISSPRAGRRNVSPCGEKERGDVAHISAVMQVRCLRPRLFVAQIMTEVGWTKDLEPTIKPPPRRLSPAAPPPCVGF